MAKHAVPKKKTSKARSSRRYKSFQNNVRTRLNNDLKLQACPNCQSMMKAHHACPVCESYRGNSMRPESSQSADLSAEPATIQTVKAD